jgi:RNA polymerase sigma-70 factor (ECF subfamily)
MSQKTDEEIAKRVQRGDVASFGLLIGQYEEKILRYAKKFLLDREDSKDLVQEVFIKAYTNIQSFDTKKKFSPWIYRIAHNEFVNAVKKRSRIPVFSFDPDLFLPHPIADETSDSEAEKKELKQTLDQSLEKISAKYREPLILYYFEELDYKEIAEILQIPTSTVGVRLRRGRMMLKKLMSPYD